MDHTHVLTLVRIVRRASTQLPMPQLVINKVNNMGKRQRNISGLVFCDRTKKIINDENEFYLDTHEQTAIYLDIFGIKLELPGIEVEPTEKIKHELVSSEMQEDLNDLTEKSAENANNMENIDTYNTIHRERQSKQ